MPFSNEVPGGILENLLLHDGSLQGDVLFFFFFFLFFFLFVCKDLVSWLMAFPLGTCF